jgi:S-(hydroxymethyl)mycothiol dehydrogenase
MDVPMAETRGVLLNEPGELALEELAVDPLGADEVQVRVEASGVCHTDLHVLETGGWGMRLPVLLGHEGAGTVEAVGEGVTSVSPGDRVVLAWRAPCGDCPACRRGDPRRCRTPLRARRRLKRARDGAVVTQALLCGTFATRTVVHEGAAVPVPAELPPEQACLLGCAVATGVGSVLNTAAQWPGARAAVIGCGAVGLSAIQGARIARAARIVAVDVAPERLELARRFGATDVVDASAADPVAAVAELTDGEGVDFAYDVVGRRGTLEQAVRMLAPAGTATLIGVPRPETPLELDLERDLFQRRTTIRVSYGGDQLPAEDVPRLARLALDGELDLAGMVTREIALEDVPDALRTLGQGSEVRSVVRPR